MGETLTASVQGALYADDVNPQWVRLLDLLQMNVQYSRCLGAELFTSDGRRFLDFLSGYCVHNTGHNHPRIVAALKDELDRPEPAMLQSHVPDLAGELAERLSARAGGRLTKVFFSSSGSEGIEAAIKFSRAHTGRSGLLFAEGAFHGLTCGALSLMGNPFWRWDSGRSSPKRSRSPSTTSKSLNESWQRNGSPHSSWSPSRVRAECACRTRNTFRGRKPSVGGMAACSFSMRCRLDFTAPAHFLPLTTLASTRMWWSLPKR